MEKVSQNKIGKITFFVLLLLFVLGFGAKLYYDSYVESALKKTKQTWAIVTQEVECDRGCLIRYKFLTDENKFLFSEYWGNKLNECHKNLKIGDTVFIKYSISDPEITEMTHCYWNEGLKKELEQN